MASAAIRYLVRLISLLLSRPTISSGETPGFARGVAVSGDYLYVADDWTGIAIFRCFSVFSDGLDWIGARGNFLSFLGLRSSGSGGLSPVTR